MNTDTTPFSGPEILKQKDGKAPAVIRREAALLKFIALFLFLPLTGTSQFIEKVTFDAADSVNGYYLAIAPASRQIKGTLVLICPYKNPESILPESKLHNVAAANDLLTVYISTGNQLLPDQNTIDRVSRVLSHLIKTYKVDPSFFVLGGFDLAGTIVLRYAEMSWEHPDLYPVRPTLVFGVASPVDLSGFYRLSGRQIKKNAFPPAVGDAQFFINTMNKSVGKPDDHPEKYRQLSPFTASDTSAGNEQFLRHVAVRLYYDTDIDWQLKARRNGFYDTNFPDASELINRLLLSGNSRAEFVVAKQPGVRSNGQRHPNAYSIVDETECIQWIKRELHLFDPSNPRAFVSPYTFDVPDGWRMERSLSPPPFAPRFGLSGIEEIRFPPGWGIFGKEDYWSVAYLFWLDAGQKIDAGVLQDNLRIYFDGLVQIGGGAVPHNIPPDKLLPTVVHIRKIKAEPDDRETYAGTIDMLDYMAMKPIRLNVMVHVKECSAQKHVPLFIEASPKPEKDAIWNDLKRMKTNFRCPE